MATKVHILARCVLAWPSSQAIFKNILLCGANLEISNAGKEMRVTIPNLISVTWPKQRGREYPISTQTGGCTTVESTAKHRVNAAVLRQRWPNASESHSYLYNS